MSYFNIELGNLVFSLRTANPEIFLAVSQRLSLFVTGKKPDYVIDINYITPAEFSLRFPMASDKIVKPFLFQDSPVGFTFMDSTTTCTVDINSKISVLTTSVTDINDILYLSLRNIISLWLMLNCKLLLHSAGVMTPQGTVLFSGVSGSGKSTIAVNSQGRGVLSDENIIVQVQGEKIIAYGTPWSGSARKMDNREGEVAALFFIQVSQKFQCIRISNAMSLFLLLRDTFLPFCDKRLLERQSTISSGIVNSLACYTLRFNCAMPIFWDYIEDTISRFHEDRRINVC